MCKQLTKSNKLCKISPNKEYCHIHTNCKVEIIYEQPSKVNTHEITMKTIHMEDKINKMQILINSLKETQKYHKNENIRLNTTINEMTDYYDKYKTIYEFESYKFQNQDMKLVGKEFQKFLSLREARNKLCHPFTKQSKDIDSD